MTVECIYNKNGICLIATKLANQPAAITTGACEHCIKQFEPMTENAVTASLAIHSHKDQITYKAKMAELEYLTRNDTVRKDGPGDRLIYLLSYLKITHARGCGCEQHAFQMNKWGAEKCRREWETIVGWMREASENRVWRWVYSDTVAKALVFLACDLAEGRSWGSIIKNLPRIIK